MRVRSILLDFVSFLILTASPALAQQGTIIGTAVDETKAGCRAWRLPRPIRTPAAS